MFALCVDWNCSPDVGSVGSVPGMAAVFVVEGCRLSCPCDSSLDCGMDQLHACTLSISLWAKLQVYLRKLSVRYFFFSTLRVESCKCQLPKK